MRITVNLDEFLDEVKLALVNEWQHLDIGEVDGEVVYKMITETLSSFKEEKAEQYKAQAPQSQASKKQLK